MVEYWSAVTVITIDASLPSGDVASMTDVLCELRASGRGATPQAENLAQKIQSRVGEVCASVGQAVSRS